MANWTRRGFTAGLAAAIPALRAAEERPNILWITCEDTGPQLRCCGDEYAVILANQGDEGAPDAWIELTAQALDGLDGIMLHALRRRGHDRLRRINRRRRGVG